MKPSLPPIFSVCRLIASFSAVALSLASSSFATSYFVSPSGNDSNAGTSPSAAWSSLAKVNNQTLLPGDHLFLQAGGIWTGQLSPKGTGTNGNPIVIDMYDSGNKPLIQANGAFSDAVHIYNQEYLEINNLEVTNNHGTGGSRLGDYRGIGVLGTDFGTINHIYVQHCFVHDVTGQVNWIGGSGSNSPGIHFGTGWDGSKHTGGVVFYVTSIGSSPVKTRFNDILVANCNIVNCSFGGIILKQWSGSVKWGIRSSPSDTNWLPHTNVVIRDNFLDQAGTPFGCNTIYVTDTRGGLVQGNVSANAGTCGIEMYYGDMITVAGNEIYNVTRKAGGGDANAIDPDSSTTGIIVERNYIHDNDQGILLFQIHFGDSVVRYNILQNNRSNAVWANTSSSCAFYNNTIYASASGHEMISGGGAHATFSNNIFYASPNATGTTFATGSVAYHRNSYFGPIKIPSDSSPLTANPKMLNPGKGGTGDAVSGPVFGTLTGYQLQTGSPCNGAGTAISNNGGIDIFGNTVPSSGNPDIGASQATGAQQQVIAPTFSPAGGAFAAPQTVTITSSTAGASIRYTLDGSMPSSSSGTLYSGPFAINGTATLSAIAFKSGSSDSPVTSEDYSIGTSTAIVVQAESGTFSPGSMIETINTGWTGTGYVNTNNAVGAFSEITVNVPIAGSYSIAIRYANGTTANRPADLSINGSVVQPGLSFPATGSWTTWNDVITTTTLNAGSNTIRLSATTTSGCSNFDKLTVR